MAGENDYKHVMQDFSNLYLGGRLSYGEMLTREDVPFKWKAVVRHYLLKEVAEDTTLENHVFFLKEGDFSLETYEQLHARFRLLVWTPADGRRRKKSGYVSREYPVARVASDEWLHRNMDTILVQELRIPKMSLMTFSV